MRQLSSAGVEAKRLCKAFPDTPTKTLARRLSKSHKMTIEHARSCIRRQRGTTGTKNRPYASVEYTPKKAGWVPEIPPSLSEKWEPFDLGNGIKVAILSDLHVPYHSEIAVASAIQYCRKRRPDVLLINGDLADFYSASRYEKDPSKRDMLKEFEAVKQMIAVIRKGFPKARIVYKLGNHDERWQKYLWNAAPEISSSPRMHISEWVDAKEYGVEVVDDQRPVMCGLLPVLHGHELGKSTFSPVNTARGVFLRTLSTMLVGHSHRTSQHVEPDWQHKQTPIWSTGCLSELRPRYAPINKWNHGAAIVEVDAKGAYAVDNFRIGPSGEIWK